MKILHITSSLDGGGIASLLMDYCSRMAAEIQFDFVITSKTEGYLEEPLKKMGCNIYRVEQFRVNPIKYIKQLCSILKNGNYDIVHNHADYRGFFGILCAKFCGVKHRIAHSHLAYVDLKFFSKVEKIIFTPLVKLLATNLVACSTAAAQWTWGKTNKEVHIMKNAINTKAYVFSKEKRESLRKELQIDDCFVVGNVARLSYQKNHDFLLDIFNEILKKNKNAVLLLIGDGELKGDIERKISHLNINKNVIMLGTRSDVPDLLNAMDCFVLPSRFEGLGIVYIEAQANGLKSYGTNKVVPKEVKISEGMTFIDEDASSLTWADLILKSCDGRIVNAEEKVFESGYDIGSAVEDMRRYYYSLCI